MVLVKCQKFHHGTCCRLRKLLRNLGTGKSLSFARHSKFDYRDNEFLEVPIKNASNFLKHADNGKMGLAKTFDFNPESNEHFIIFAIIGLRYLGENLTAGEIAFERWQIFQKPHLVTNAGLKLFKQAFTADNLAKIRGIPKSQFLEAFRLLIRQSAGG